MKLTDYPHYYPESDYKKALTTMVSNLSKNADIKSIYQIGGISNLGISDIDILAVFNDDSSYAKNPIDSLSKQDRYFFTHSLFGLSEENFFESFNYPFFHSFKLLHGAKLNPRLQNDLSPIMEIQVGLEFLIKMFITMTVERTYGIVKVRNLLLLSKGLLFDMDYLGIKSGTIISLLDEIVEWRNNWFKSQPTPQELKKWHNSFYNELQTFLRKYTSSHTFYLQAGKEISISQNISLANANKFYYTHNGLTLPNIFAGIGKKYFNVQNRFNTFVFNIPMSSNEIPTDIQNRNAFATKAFRENSKQYPGFSPGAYAFNIF